MNEKEYRHGNRCSNNCQQWSPQAADTTRQKGLWCEEAIGVIRKETCPNCKGNRYVSIETSDGDSRANKCPHCDGNGYRIRVTLTSESSRR